ncbi:hypothetical protein NZK33_08645 [Cyanobium sp. FGCU-6]|jgi:glycosyltransferase involved in cell wall biosynthesis|nr:hypothetical protein [Cyanobium sp. FGCU6]
MKDLRIAYLPELIGSGGLLSPCSSIRTDYYLKQLAVHSGAKIRYFYEVRGLDPLHYDVIFVNRLAIPSIEEVKYLLHTVQKAPAPIPVILDLDDDLLAIPPEHVDYQRIHPRLEALALLVKKADAVIVSTPELAQALPRGGNARYVIPNRVLLPRIRALPEAAFHGATRVLYFGTASHIHELHTLQPLFDSSSPWFSGLQLVVAGIVSSDSHWYTTINLLHPCVDTFLDRLASLEGYRCGLAPLRLDDPLNRSKSEIKIFDYAYLGLPVIASSCPQYQRTIVHGRTGFLVSENPKEWIQYLKLLQSDRRCAEVSAEAAAHLAALAPSDKAITSTLIEIIHSIAHSYNQRDIRS